MSVPGSDVHDHEYCLTIGVARVARNLAGEQPRSVELIATPRCLRRRRGTVCNGRRSNSHPALAPAGSQVGVCYPRRRAVCYPEAGRRATRETGP